MNLFVGVEKRNWLCEWMTNERKEQSMVQKSSIIIVDVSEIWKG